MKTIQTPPPQPQSAIQTVAVNDPANANSGVLTYSPYAPRAAVMQYHLRWQRWAVLICHRRFGKALALDTDIPMADGSWKKMGDLVDGDAVLDENGKPTKVLAAHPVLYNRPCYRVTFSDGTEVIADEDHLWETSTKLERAHTVRVPDGSRPYQPKPPQIRTTKEIAQTLRARGETNHSVRLALPVELPCESHLIDPYILGVWLGDGTTRSPQVTTMDAEIVESMRAYAEKNGFELNKLSSTSSGRASTYSITGGLITLLKQLGVVQNKHIPDSYMRGSIEQRTELLRGLMDTDGSISNKGSTSFFYQKDRHICEQVRQLLASLGVQSHISSKLIKDCLYWTVVFRSHFNPFRLARKADRWSPCTDGKRYASQSRMIVAAEPIPTQPVRCITVDSPNSLYLCTRAYIPTHNTVGVLNDLIARAMMMRADGLRQQFAYVAPTQVQARAVVWEYLKQYTKPYASSPAYKISEQHLTVTLPDPTNDAMPGSTIMLLGAENAERMRGLFLDGVIIDEAQLVPRYVVDAIVRPALADRGGWMTICGTVNSPDDLLWSSYETALKNPDTHFALIIRASESGVLPQDELDDLKRTMTNEAYEAEMECNVHAVKQGRIFLPYLDIKKQTAVPFDPAAGPVITAWDLGVSDTTSIWFAQIFGITVRLIHFYEQSGQGLDHFVEYMSKLPFARAYGGHLLPHDSRVRELGTGVSRIETLRNLGLRNMRVVNKLAKAQQIDAARLLLPKCWFDAEGTNSGIIALRNYAFEFDKKREVYSQTPRHDKHSNAADAFQQLAVGLRMARTMTDDGNATYDATINAFDFGGLDDAPQAPYIPPAGF